MPYAPDLSGCALDGRYELHAVIGEGAFGRVYRGRDRRLERTVAIKLIKPWWGEDPEWALSFEREARLLARVSDPGIVQIFDIGQAEEGLYYVSELVEGESLADRLTRGPLTPAEAVGVAQQLCRALDRAHARQVVHRDVKPANILISSEGLVKVGDFGVAQLAEGSTGAAGATIVGTPRYMAPEQARGLRITPATDVYSAGIVLYEMLAGRAPFTDAPAVELALRHLREQPAPLPATVPAGLAAVVARALAKDPADRYATGGQMAEALAARSDLARSRPLPVRVPPAATANQALIRGQAVRSAEPTRRAPRHHPRRNLNPSARRRNLTALAAVFILLSAMIAGALVLGGAGRVRVPRLIRLTRGQVRARTRSLALGATFRFRYDGRARPGTVIGQRPRAGREVVQGATIQVTLSAGPAPVKVPDLAGESATLARAALQAAGLRARVLTTPAPRLPAGVVFSQSPAPGSEVKPTRTVTVDVAETPRWQPLTGLQGSGGDTSVSFHVRGGRWRIVYTTAYQGTCTLIFICSGPSAGVDNIATGSTVGSFDLSDGGRQTRLFSTGPGTFRLQITPGSDTARWSAWVEDWY